MVQDTTKGVRHQHQCRLQKEGKENYVGREHYINKGGHLGPRLQLETHLAAGNRSLITHNSSQSVLR